MSTLNNPIREAGSAPPRHPGDIPMPSIPAGQRKVPPTHPGAVVEDLLDANGVGLRPAARAIGMSSTGLNKVLLGLSPVTVDTALRFAAYFGNSPEHWLDMQRACDLHEARARLGKELEKIVRIKPVER